MGRARTPQEISASSGCSRTAGKWRSRWSARPPGSSRSRWSGSRDGRPSSWRRGGEAVAWCWRDRPKPSSRIGTSWVLVLVDFLARRWRWPSQRPCVVPLPDDPGWGVGAVLWSGRRVGSVRVRGARPGRRGGPMTGQLSHQNGCSSSGPDGGGRYQRRSERATSGAFGHRRSRRGPVSGLKSRPRRLPCPQSRPIEPSMAWRRGR